MGYLRIRFPCGLEYTFSSFWGYGCEDDVRRLYNCGCPIHGKKCK